MILPFIEWGQARDEHADGRTHGIFISQWCLLGVQLYRWRNGGWRFGVIVANIVFGIWKEV